MLQHNQQHKTKTFFLDKDTKLKLASPSDQPRFKLQLA